MTVLKPAPFLQLRAPRRPHILCEPVAAPLQAVVERQTSPARWVFKPWWSVRRRRRNGWANRKGPNHIGSRPLCYWWLTLPVLAYQKW